MDHDFQEGDYAEFASDRQIESGPCSGKLGRVTDKIVEFRQGMDVKVLVRHSLKVKKTSNHYRGGRLWIFE